MVEHPAGWRPPAWSALMAVAGDAETAAAAVQSGADVIDLRGAADAQIAAFAAAHPAVPYCGYDRSADIVTDQRTAAGSGAWLICPDLEFGRQSGLPQSQLLVAASPAEIPPLAAAGWLVIVDADMFGGEALGGVLAAAALSCWLGAAAVRTSQPAQVRQAIDMTASILGLRPPARTVRGLA